VWPSFLVARIRVANLAFMKPDFEILAFLNTFRYFGNQKIQTKSVFFLAFLSVEKAMTLAKQCLSCIFLTNLF